MGNCFREAEAGGSNPLTPTKNQGLTDLAPESPDNAAGLSRLDLLEAVAEAARKVSDCGNHSPNCYVQFDGCVCGREAMLSALDALRFAHVKDGDCVCPRGAGSTCIRKGCPRRAVRVVTP